MGTVAATCSGQRHNSNDVPRPPCAHQPRPPGIRSARSTSCASRKPPRSRRLLDSPSRPATCRTIGSQDQRRRLLTRANAAEADYEHARPAAQRRDEASAEAAERHTARLAEQHTDHERQARALETERHLRAEMGEPARELEQAERAAALQPAEATVSEAELSAGQVEQPIASIEQQAQQPDPGEPQV